MSIRERERERESKNAERASFLKRRWKLKNKSLTLIEIIIALTIMAILVTIIIVFLKPSLIFAKARDTQRFQDIKNINDSIDVFNGDDPSANFGSPDIAYISLPDSSATCSSWTSSLPSLPTGWSYQCAPQATFQNVNGTGWIPINFSSDPMENISSLPVDPTNKPPYFYTYVTDPQWEVSAYMEVATDRGPNSIAGKDGGSSYSSYEQGSSLTLTPLAILNNVISNPSGVSTTDPTLLGWWPITEGAGSAILDHSIYNHNGFFTNASSTCGSACLPSWVQENNGYYALYLPPYAYVQVNSFTFPATATAFTASLWFKTSFAGNDLIRGIAANNGNVWCEGNAFVLIVDNYHCWGNNLPGFSFGPNTTPYWYPSRANDNLWHMMTVTYDGSSQIGYLDGIEAVNEATTTPITTGNTLYFGLSMINNSYMDLGEVKIYDRALSPSDVLNLYNTEVGNYNN